MVKMIKMMPQILASNLYFACTCIPVIKRQVFGLRIWWSMLAFFTVSPWNVCRPPQSNEFRDVELNKDKSFFFFNWRISQGLKDSSVHYKPLCRARNAVFPNRSHHERSCSESQGTGESWNILEEILILT